MTSKKRSSSKGTTPKNKTSPFTLRNLIYRKAWDGVEQVCQNSPSQAKATDKLGDLPLHEACLGAAPFHVIKNLLYAHPEGVKAKGFCGRLPLHYASYNKPSLNIIKLLLKNYPEGACMKDSDGRLPVHLAVVRNAPKEAILVLISAFPKSLHTPNNFGSTPGMLARNEHIEHILLDEESRPRNVEKTMETVKKLQMVWSATNGIVSKNEIGLKKRPHTTGHILKPKKITHKHTSLKNSSKALLADRIGKPTHNNQNKSRPIFKRGGGKQIPPPKGMIFETIRTSIPTPPSSPGDISRSVSSRTLVSKTFPFNKAYSQPLLNAQVEQALLA